MLLLKDGRGTLRIAKQVIRGLLLIFRFTRLMQFRYEVSALHVDLVDEPGSDLDRLPMIHLLYAVADAFILFQYDVFLLCY